MANSDGRVLDLSLSTVNKNDNQFSDVDDDIDSGWDVSDVQPDGLSSQNSRRDCLYQFPIAIEDRYDEVYDSDGPNNSLPSMPPEVNLKNVMSGIFAILTGRNKTHAPTGQQFLSSDVSFLGPEKNGENLFAFFSLHTKCSTTSGTKSEELQCTQRSAGL
ncbi:hypothetical protein SAY87_029730 [Trapa incisa]|uniref:Uncharacterized protein n=1 Tax=Trapa incisa TaxID=236973 RepID=A0AAN7K816_9MYRT|nr:hypothetical protein SAY87_029730 [Trapa incisa]